jgi:DNA-binding response OmpR family regulator
MAARQGWVLVVEDDEQVGSLLQQQVTQQGFRCERALDGAAALQTVIMARVEPALVLLDLGLAYMDGESLALEMRRLLGQRVPIVLVSGRPRERLASVARRVKASFLAKPFELVEVEDLLERHLGSCGPRRIPVHGRIRRRLGVGPQTSATARSYVPGGESVERRVVERVRKENDRAYAEVGELV